MVTYNPMQKEPFLLGAVCWCILPAAPGYLIHGNSGNGRRGCAHFLHSGLPCLLTGTEQLLEEEVFILPIAYNLTKGTEPDFVIMLTPKDSWH